MKTYSQIFNSAGELVPTQKIQMLKRLVRKAKQQAGIFKCVCPKGAIHKWEIQIQERKMSDKKVLLRATAKWIT
jgi:hypothetical protein